MTFLIRSAIRASATQTFKPTFIAVPRRFAGDYGSVQSGHEQGIEEKNPKQHMEHPGPDPPSTKASNGSPPDSGSKDGAEPKIHQPASAAEDQNADVKKHNDEMKNRADKTANQLSEQDNKVNKEFWTGDVGDVKSKKG